MLLEPELEVTFWSFLWLSSEAPSQVTGCIEFRPGSPKENLNGELATSSVVLPI